MLKTNSKTSPKPEKLYSVMRQHLLQMHRETSALPVSLWLTITLKPRNAFRVCMYRTSPNSGLLVASS